jgi:hypothetical protein
VLCWLGGPKYRFRANNHGSNPDLCIILSFLPFKCREQMTVKTVALYSREETGSDKFPAEDHYPIKNTCIFTIFMCF